MAPASCYQAASKHRRSSPRSCRLLCAATTSTTTPFRAVTRYQSARLAITAQRRRWSSSRTADVVLALGTRLNPFSTLPGYGLDYWPKDAKLIQVDINSDRIGLTKPVAVAIQGDAKAVAEQLLTKLSSKAGDKGRKEREEQIAQTEVGLAAATVVDGS